MDHDVRATEIGRIEQELAALREHYAVLQRGGERLRMFVPIAFVALAALLVALMIKDLAAGLFALFIALVVVAIGYVTRTIGPRSKKFRWIDAAVPAPHEFYFGPSEAERTETWIADRERRLAELKSVA
jgi:hypothetical protein